MDVSILGCGWLGLPLAEALVHDGHRVRGSTTDPAKRERIRRAGAAPHVLRVGGEISGERDGFFASETLIVTLPASGARYLDRLAAIVGAARAGEAEWLLFTSSTSVYNACNKPVDETDATPPASERGKLLREAEALFLRSPLDATILRLGGLYGPGREPGRFLAGKRDVGGARNPVNLVHRDDVIGVVRRVLERNARNEIFNVVADAHPPRADFYRSHADRLGLEPPHFSDAPIPWKVVRSRKLRDVLGYDFRHRPQP